ncbi:MAG: VWA domain-containing protein [Acidobacteriota bacterium]
MRRPVTPLLLALMAGGLIMAAQEAVFRVMVDTVPVYVSVQDGRGRPITGLSAGDFRVFEAGVQQKILSFQEIGMGAAKPPESDPLAAAGVEAVAGGADLEQRERRYIVLRFDALLGSRALQRAQQAARKVLEEMDGSRDWLAVSWRQSISEFGRDRQRLARLIDEIKPSLLALSLAADAPADPVRARFLNAPPPTGDPVGADSGADLSDIFPETPQLRLIANVTGEIVTLGARSAFAPTISGLKYLRGRKIVFYFGLGLGVPRIDDRDKSRYEPEINARLFSDAGFTLFAINPLGLQASATNPLPVTGPRRGGRQSMRSRSEATFRMPGASGLENIFLRKWAEATGGFAVYNQNNLTKAVHRVFDYNRHYYLLTYRPSREEYDARFRQIKVELVTRKGKVHHRNGYFATAPAPADLLGRSLYTALLSPDLFVDFPLEVDWSRSPKPNQIQVHFSFPFEKIELISRKVLTGRRKTEKRHFQNILLVSLMTDNRGRVLGSLQEIFRLTLDDDQLSELRSQNATIDRAIQLMGPGEPATLRSVVIVGQNRQLSSSRIALQ